MKIHVSGYLDGQSSGHGRDGSSETEVRQLELPVLSDQNILWLEIPVGNNRPT